MPDSIETTLAAAVNGDATIGQILIQQTGNAQFVLSHREDAGNGGVGTAAPGEVFHRAEDAIEIARFDDAGNYRPLKTAPNLRHGWQLNVAGMDDLRRALDHFYPGRLAALAAWNRNGLAPTSLRDTLNRQSGMYRVAAKISDEQIDQVAGCVCKSNGGCLRTILWKRDGSGAVPSTKLPPEKYDPGCDQSCSGRAMGDAALHSEAATAIPLLCQEACAVLVNECRKAVKT